MAMVSAVSRSRIERRVEVASGLTKSCTGHPKTVRLSAMLQATPLSSAGEL